MQSPNVTWHLKLCEPCKQGDSVFGIIAFIFPDLEAGKIPDDTKLVLQATDMLGRTIESEEITFADINNRPLDVFPCPVKN
jgi:hypothetical protein